MIKKSEKTNQPQSDNAPDGTLQSLQLDKILKELASLKIHMGLYAVLILVLLAFKL